MPRPRSHRRESRRPWYRVDVWSALDRLHQYFSHLLHLRPFGPAKPFTLRGYLVELLDLQSLATPKRAATFKPELTPLELRWLMDARPLPYPVIFAGAGAGSTPAIVAYAADTGEEKFSRLVYEESFTGGVRVAAADFNRDGYPDLLVGPGPGGAPHIQVLDGKSGNPIAGPLGSFYGYEPWFNGGVNVAAADVDGDTIPDAILAAGIGGGPRVRVLSGADGHVIANFYALDPDFRGGISIAAADLNGDGKAELAIGAGEDGGPRVRVYDGATLQPLAGPLGSFFAFAENFRGGVFVGADGLAGDVNADGTFDLAVSAGPGMASAVTVYSGATGEVLRELSPFGSFTGGVRTALAYVDDDVRADIVVGSGPGMVGTVRVFSGSTGEQLASPIGEYIPFGSATGGVAVAASNDPVFIIASAWYDSDSDGFFDFGESAASGITMTLSKGGTQIASGTTDGGGYYTFNGLDTDTDYVVNAMAPAGYTSQGPYTVNTGTVGNSKSIGLSPTSSPPPPPPVAITGFSMDTGASASDRITNDPSLTITGTAPALGTVYVYRRITTEQGMVPGFTAMADGNGDWSEEFVDLEDGVHEFAVLPSQEPGEFAQPDFSAPFTVVVDRAAPTVSLSLDAGATAYSTAPKIWVTVSDLVGFAASPTVTLDVDLNNDNDYADAGETGYATATMAFGHAVFSGYDPLSVGTVKMRARITDLAGNEGASASTTVTISSSPDTWTVTDRTSGAVSPYAGMSGNEASGWLNAGDVTASHTLNLALNAAYAKADLVYHSSEANPTPVVQGTIRSDNAKGIPDNVLATLTFDGAVVADLDRAGTGLVAGDDWAFALSPSSAASTGRHTYTLDLFIDYPGGGDDVSRSITGSLFVVNRSSGPYGAGWSLSSVDTLYSVSSSGSDPAGLLRAFGTGGWSFYATSGGGYTSPAGDPGTLTNLGGGGYRYTGIDGSIREFDSSGRQTKSISANGSETTTFTLDMSNRLSTITSPDSTVATFAYDVNSRVETIASRSGVASFAYTTGELTAITNPGGGQHTFTYDGSHRLLSDANYKVRREFTYTNGMAATFKSGSATARAITPSLGVGMAANATGAVRGVMEDEVGAAPEQAFNTLGQVVGQYGADGGYTAVNRDSNGFITSTVDPLGRRTTYTLDGAGFVTQVALPGGGYQTATYDNGNGHHSLLTSTDPLNKTTSYTYTGAGQVATMTDPTGGVTSYTYAAGLRESVTDPLGDVVTTVYDSYRRPIGQIMDGQTTGTVLYDTSGRFAGRTDPLGNTTTIVNDAAGRPMAVTTPDGATTTTVYDAGGLVLSRTAASGVTTSYAYDSAGRTTETILGYGSGSAETTTAVYDAAGHVLAVVDPLGNRTTTTYDGQGRAVGTTDPLGNSTRTVYDLNGRVAATIDQLGRSTRFTYDADGLLVNVIDPLGNATTTVYDTAGRAVATIDARGDRTTAVYDAAGRMVATVDPLGNRSTAVYDASGRVVASVDPLGNRTTTVYDESGRVWSTVDALGNRTTNTYDAASRLVAVTDPLNHTSTTVYDSSNRVVASVDPLGNRSTSVYDSAGRFSASVDPLGNRTTTVYDVLGRVSATIDAAGNRSTSVYDGAGRVAASIDPFGYRNTSVYDAAGRVVATVDPLGNRSTTTYNAIGEVLAVTDPLGRSTAFAYDAAGRRTTVVDPLGNTSTIVYDAEGHAIARIDALNNRTTTVYDSADRVSAVINALNQRSTSAYDAAGNRITSIDALNRTSTTVYDALNRSIASVDPLGNRTTSAYDAAGHMTAWTDALNRTTTSVYDDAGRAIATVDPLGNRATSVYDAAGNRTASIDALANRTTFVYDALNRVSAVIDPLSNRSTKTYDAAGRTLAMIDALNHRTTFNYDAAGRLTSRLDALEKTWQTVYDNAGNAIATVDPLGNRTTTVYDDANHAVAVVNALGNRTTSVYDAVGRTIATVDPLGHRSTTGYDALGRVLTNTDALNGVTSFAYDAVGNRTSLTDPVGNRTTWVYDAANRVVTETDPLNQNSTFAYDAAGYLRSTTDRLGRRIDYAFDDAGRKSTEKWYAVGGGLSQTQTWTYDAAGRMLTAQDPDGTYTLAYDAAGRVSSVEEPFSLVLTFGYDAVGNRTSVQDTKGGTATMTFDARNMQASEELGGTGVTPIKELRSYTDAGRLDTVTRQKSSLGMWSNVGTTTHAYDAAGRLSGITHKDTVSAFASYAYAYDAADRLTSETINGAQRTYTYDHTDQLTTDAGTPYSYDANGNRTMSGYATGTGNRMSNDGVWTYTYDAEGNVTKKSKGAAADTWTYGYDHRNQMTTAAFAATDGGTVTQRVTYVYDAIGNRIERDAWDGSTAVVERFGMDGWDPAKPRPVGFEQFDAWADLDASNALVTRRNYASGFDEITARQSAGGTVAWYLTDHLGSVRGVTNGDGTPLTTISYDAWGTVLTNSTTGSSDRYQYTGREWDSGMALSYYRARVRENGTWYSEDQLGLRPDANPYRYVRNLATVSRDPSGSWAWVVHAIRIALLGGGTATVPSVTVGTPTLLAGGGLVIGTATVVGAQPASSGISYEPYNGLDGMGAIVNANDPPAFTPVTITSGPGTYINGTVHAYSQSAMNYAQSTYGGSGGGWRPGAGEPPPPIVETLIRTPLIDFTRTTRTPSEALQLANQQYTQSVLNAWAGPSATNQTQSSQSGQSSSCFARGTPLRTPNGFQRVEDFRVGDYVLSRDEHDSAGDIVARQVDDVFVGEALIWHLHIAGQVIRTTAEHPFYDRIRGWTPANSLNIGDQLLLEDGQWQPVEDMLDTGVCESVCNLRIGGFATYFVGCDEWGFSVWAHNACVSIYKAPTAGRGGKQFISGYDATDLTVPPPWGNGKLYFAKDRWIADTYAAQGPYGEGVIETQIDEKEYNAHLKIYEQVYVGSNIHKGGNLDTGVELAVPASAWPVINKGTRIWYP